LDATVAGTLGGAPDDAYCFIGYNGCMASELPIVTRREIVREYRPDRAVTEASAIRGLRLKDALSAGLAVDVRGVGGKLGGSVHFYSALNRDAARALRRGDRKLAAQLAKGAARLEQSAETRRLVASLADAGTLGSTAALARALSAPTLAKDVAVLQRKYLRARADIVKALAPTVLGGHIAKLDEAIATMSFDHLTPALTVPRLVADEADVARVGAAVNAIWEVLPGGRTVITIEPAVDTPELSSVGEPLADIYGTPWGRILSEEDAAALQVTGIATMAIPDDIPDVS